MNNKPPNHKTPNNRAPNSAPGLALESGANDGSNTGTSKTAGSDPNVNVKAAIVAIGTEITHGQILNSNAQYLSKELHLLGFKVALHLSCPDEIGLMRKNLEFAQEHVDLVFLTGGLGPTTDDLTRDLVAEVLGAPLKESTESKERITTKLTSRKIKVTQGHLRQCYFPEGSVVLPNSVGTADGFYIEKSDKLFAVLPGPPSELKSIWKEHLESSLTQRFPNIEGEEVLSWDTLGQPESAIAEIIETQAGDLSPAEAGYRVHLPFVEFKLIYRKSQKEAVLKVSEKIDKLLGPLTALKNGQETIDLWAQALRQLAPSRIQIYDGLGESYFTKKLLLSDSFKNLMSQQEIEISIHRFKGSTKKSDSKSFLGSGNEIHSEIYRGVQYDVHFGIEDAKQDAEGVLWAKAWIRFCKGDKSWGYEESWPSTYKASTLAERTAMYFYEKALLFWIRLLKRQSQDT